MIPVTFGLLGLAEREIPDRVTTTLIVALACYVLLASCSWKASLFRELEYWPHLPTLKDNSEHSPSHAL